METPYQDSNKVFPREFMFNLAVIFVKKNQKIV